MDTLDTAGGYVVVALAVVLLIGIIASFAALGGALVSDLGQWVLNKHGIKMQGSDKAKLAAGFLVGLPVAATIIVVGNLLGVL